MSYSTPPDHGGFGRTDGGGAGGGRYAPGEGPGMPAGLWVQWAGAASSVALVLGVVIWGYKLAVRDVSGVPVIRALEGPSRIAPENPGGDLAVHLGLAVNEVAGAGVAAPGPERVVLAPPPDDLAADDAPMASLRPLPVLPPLLAEPAPSAGVPAPLPQPVPEPVAPPRPDMAQPGATQPDMAQPEAALPETAEGAAPPPAEEVIPATVPGLARSPRPLPRPALERNFDLQAEAAAQSVAEALGGGGAKVVEVDPSSLPEGTRVAQLGAFDSAEIARAEWGRMAERFGPLMEGKKRIVQEAVSGGRSFWRLRVHGFENVDEARRFCAALVAEGANCIPTLAR